MTIRNLFEKRYIPSIVSIYGVVEVDYDGNEGDSEWFETENEAKHILALLWARKEFRYELRHMSYYEDYRLIGETDNRGSRWPKYKRWTDDQDLIKTQRNRIRELEVLHYGN